VSHPKVILLYLFYFGVMCHLPRLFCFICLSLFYFGVMCRLPRLFCFICLFVSVLFFKRI
jgi:hypothetical protein